MTDIAVVCWYLVIMLVVVVVVVDDLCRRESLLERENKGFK